MLAIVVEVKQPTDFFGVSSHDDHVEDVLSGEGHVFGKEVGNGGGRGAGEDCLGGEVLDEEMREVVVLEQVGDVDDVAAHGICEQEKVGVDLQRGLDDVVVFEEKVVEERSRVFVFLDSFGGERFGDVEELKFVVTAESKYFHERLCKGREES